MNPATPAELLALLRDIHLPPEPGVWPPAPGWWLLGVVVLTGFCWLGWRGLQALQRYLLYRRVAKQLKIICARFEESGSEQQLTAEISRLLRRAALREQPRQNVAGLTGSAWLDFLDSGSDTDEFSNGPGRCLVTVPYGAAEKTVDSEGLVDLVRRWLRTNLGR